MIVSAGRDGWALEVAATLAAVTEGRLGFADLVLVSVPPIEELRRRRDADQTRRRRRNFELHAQLAEPLRQWYQAVERVDPGRVQWELPPAGLASTLPPPRTNRSDPALFEAVVEALQSTA